MSPLLDALARAYAQAGELAALIDGTRIRSPVAAGERPLGLSCGALASNAKTPCPPARALAGAPHARDDRDALAA
jgi:hypothetical protein